MDTNITDFMANLLENIMLFLLNMANGYVLFLVVLAMASAVIIYFRFFYNVTKVQVNV